MDSEEEYPDSKHKLYVNHTESSFSRYLTPTINTTTTNTSSVLSSLSAKASLTDNNLLDLSKIAFDEAPIDLNLAGTVDSLKLINDNLPPNGLLSNGSPKSNSSLNVSNKLRNRRALRNTTSLEFPAYSHRLMLGHPTNLHTNHVGLPWHSTAPATPTSWRDEENLSLSKTFSTYFSSAALRKRCQQQIALSPSLSRRNSSPSRVCLSAMNSSRERISPQAIQELIEFSRINNRRAVSPDSRLSSRSSSPQCSSGRASPCLFLAYCNKCFVLAVLGIVSRLKASNLLPTTSGMRKLSSSPHLLGICEESEEGSDSLTEPFCVKVPHKASSLAGVSVNLKSRGSRSSSMGLSYGLKGNAQRSMDSFNHNLSNASRASFSTSLDSEKELPDLPLQLDLLTSSGTPIFYEPDTDNENNNSFIIGQEMISK